MSYGTVRVGRVVLREALTRVAESLNAATGERTLSISGQEASPPLTAGDVAALQDDLLGLRESLVPVMFTTKSDRDGYYVVKDANAELFNWGGEIVTCDWKLVLTRLGSESEVDVESRLGSTQTRVNVHGATGERWHAPPGLHYAYWSGSTAPSVVERMSDEGPLTVYRGVPVNTNPRFACSVENYLLGAVRFLDGADHERAGTDFGVSPGAWTLTNGLVRVQPSLASGVLEIAAYAGSWAAKTWDLRVSNVSLGIPDATTLLRNDPECVTVRLLWTHAVGRTEADLVLRRGARLVEVHIKRQLAATIRVTLTDAEDGTASAGYLAATANDSDGNRYIVGSAGAFTSDINAGAILQNSVTEFAVFIGAIVGGASAVAGDTAADLFAQYLGAPVETVRGVRR